MNSQSLQALILQELMEAARTGGAVNSSDLAAKYHSTNVRRRIKELGDDYGIRYKHEPTQFFRDPFTGRMRRKGDDYRLTETPESALEKFELGPHPRASEAKDTVQGGGSDPGGLLNAKQGVVEEARKVSNAARTLGERSAAVRAGRKDAPHTAPGGLTWPEYRAKKKEDQTCLI